jgi:RNA polymerase sigma factor (sigma-70 family)
MADRPVARSGPGAKPEWVARLELSMALAAMSCNDADLPMIAFMPWTPRRAALPPPADDASLARRVAERDSAALDAVYRRDAGAVYRYVLALGGNAAWAADATQQAFITFADRPNAFDAARGPLSAYLAGMARHHLMALWRERPLADPDAADGVLPAASIDEATPEALLVKRQGQEALWAALAALPWPQREALVLVDLQQRPYAEAAAIAGIELNTLRTRVHRARARLAQALQGGAVTPASTTGAEA